MVISTLFHVQRRQLIMLNMIKLSLSKSRLSPRHSFNHLTLKYLSSAHSIIPWTEITPRVVTAVEGTNIESFHHHVEKPCVFSVTVEGNQ